MAFNTIRSHDFPGLTLTQLIAELDNPPFAGSNHPALLIINSVVEVDQDQGIDSRYTLRIERGGQLHFSGSTGGTKHQLVVAGEIEAGANHVFVDLDDPEGSSGRVVAAPRSLTEVVRPEWWGARADFPDTNVGHPTPALKVSTDNLVPIRAAIDFFSGLDEQEGGGDVRFRAAYYRLEGALQLRDNIALRGRAAAGCRRRGTALYFVQMDEVTPVDVMGSNFDSGAPAPNAAVSSPLVLAINKTSEPWFVRIEDMAFAGVGHPGATMALENCRAQMKNVAAGNGSQEAALIVDSTVNSLFERVQASGLRVEGSATSTTFSACSFAGTTGVGVRVSGAVRSIRFCDGTIIEHIDGTGVLVRSSDGIVTIDGCHFEDVGGDYVSAGNTWFGWGGTAGSNIVRGLDVRRCEMVGGAKTTQKQGNHVVKLGNVRHADVSIPNVAGGPFKRRAILRTGSTTRRVVYTAPWFVEDAVTQRETILSDPSRVMKVGEPAFRIGAPANDQWQGGHPGIRGLTVHPDSRTPANREPFLTLKGQEGQNRHIVPPRRRSYSGVEAGFFKVETMEAPDGNPDDAWVPFFRSIPPPGGGGRGRGGS